ncbi:GSU3473 family protein [Geomobilimonas luticola]|uniref:GSU3473 family protein n=1 Tax=Geomobilimonas luticola TaxID=1114878 RepID=UPI0031B8A90D
MLIRAIYEDYTRGMIKDSYLDNLIRQGKIVGFFRTSGYVRIGHDPIRGTGGEYKGPERRRRPIEYQ